MTEIIQPQIVLNARRRPESKETLARSLDDLLERYLNLLNEYQKLQQDLNKSLAIVYSASAHHLDNVLMLQIGLYITCASQLFQSESDSLRQGLLRRPYESINSFVRHFSEADLEFSVPGDANPDP